MPNNIIITGGPGSGKSTLLNILHENGHSCMPEVSRQLIQQQVTMHSQCVPWNDLGCFARLALDKMIFDYQTTNQTGTTFFDRGIPDIIAYLKVGKLTVEPRFYEAARKYRYAHSVFVAPPWEVIYVNDNERWQTFEEACILYETLVLTYSDLGYHIIELPLATVEERMAFVFKTLPYVKSY